MSNDIEVHELQYEQHEQPTIPRDANGATTNTEPQHDTTIPDAPTTSVPSIHAEDVLQEEPTVKAKAKQRGGRKKASDVPDLKEKVACPDCNKTVSLHSLKFTHKKYCKAQKIEVQPVEHTHELINVLEVTPAGNPEVHYVQYDPAQVTMEHIQQLKTQKKQIKQSKYKQMLAGKI